MILASSLSLFTVPFFYFKAVFCRLFLGRVIAPHHKPSDTQVEFLLAWSGGRTFPRWHPLLLGRGDETHRGVPLTINPTVVRIAPKFRPLLFTVVNSRVWETAIKKWFDISLDLMDKVTGPEPIMTRPFGTNRCWISISKTANSSTSLIVAALSNFLVVIAFDNPKDR